MNALLLLKPFYICIENKITLRYPLHHRS